MANDHNDDILLDLFHPSLTLLDKSKAVAEARAAYLQAVEDVQSECGHTVVFRCDWRESPYGGRAEGPVLQCAHCLLQEDEWRSSDNRLGKTYDKSNGRKYLTISREALMGRRLRG